MESQHRLMGIHACMMQMGSEILPDILHVLVWLAKRAGCEGHSWIAGCLWLAEGPFDSDNERSCVAGAPDLVPFCCGQEHLVEHLTELRQGKQMTEGVVSIAMAFSTCLIVGGREQMTVQHGVHILCPYCSSFLSPRPNKTNGLNTIENKWRCRQCQVLMSGELWTERFRQPSQYKTRIPADSRKLGSSAVKASAFSQPRL